jgi:hypothetical protein
LTAKNFEVSEIMGDRNRDEPMVPEEDGPFGKPVLPADNFFLNWWKRKKYHHPDK